MLRPGTYNPAGIRRGLRFNGRRKSQTLLPGSTRPIAVGGRQPAMSFGSAYERSWAAVAPGSGVRKIAYQNPGRNIRISRTRVGVDLTIRADPRLQAFMKRLPKAAPQFRRQLTKALRTAVREEFLKPLRANIPHSGRSKKVTRIDRGTRIDRKKRGRTQVYGRKKHIRQTARIAQVKTERIVVTVGSADLWYAAILHSRVPFFPKTAQEALPALNKRIEAVMYDMMRYLATGYRKAA